MDTDLFIPLDHLRHRATYALRSRNLLVGVWDANSNGFVGVREKMGDIYLFTEYHYDLGGTAHALVELPLNVPEDIDLREIMDPVCNNHSEKVVFTTPIAKGGSGWIHVGSREKCDGTAMAAVNKDLFGLLEPIHTEMLRTENRKN